MDNGYSSLSPDLLSFSLLGVTMNLEHPISEVVTSSKKKRKKKKIFLIVTLIFTGALLQKYEVFQLTFGLIGSNLDRVFLRLGVA